MWLTQLHDQLTSNETVAVTQAVTGLGGIGKTQLALAYCYRHLDEYDIIQWLRADDATTLSTEMAEMAYRLNTAPRQMTDQDALRQQTLNWLHTADQRWLLVLDNADTIEPAALQPYLPRMGNGATLITSRNPNLERLANVLRLDLFTEDEAVAFLVGARNTISLRNRISEAKRVAKLLGYLPLALEHARAYVAAAECTLAEYAEAFETERDLLWAETEAPLDYDQKTITTTWEMAFAEAKKTEGAAALLNLCCFLAPEGIPIQLLMAQIPLVGSRHALTLPEELVTLAKSKIKLNRAIATLRRYSLLTRNDDELTVHRHGANHYPRPNVAKESKHLVDNSNYSVESSMAV